RNATPGMRNIFLHTGFSFLLIVSLVNLVFFLSKTIVILVFSVSFFLSLGTNLYYFIPRGHPKILILGCCDHSRLHILVLIHL
ncbi:hypothetical protein ACJX0J_027012, partial [Zea mays]